MGIAKALFVGTTANIAGTTTLAGVTATSITDSGLTSGRVTYAGTAGLLQDSANLTFNGTTLTVGSGNSALKIDALGANNFEIYNGALTADGTNYAFAQNYTGANTQVNAASGGQVLLQIAGTTKATLTSTGLAVTGTLSATSTLSTSDTTDSSSTTTGALKTAGGLGVAKTASLNILHEVTGEAWTAYTPTITVDTGTITSTVTIARYRLLGKTLFISLAISWTVTSGVPSEVRITTPLSLLAQSSSMYITATVQNNGVSVFGGIRTQSTAARVVVFVPGDAFVGSGAINGNFVIEVQ